MTPADQIINKVLTALVYVRAYFLPSTSSRVVRVTNPNETVGIVYSYIQNAEGFWWMLRDNTYVLHGRGVFDWNLLREQGVLTTEELIALQREGDLSITDKVLGFLKGNVLPTIVVVVLAAVAIKASIGAWASRK